MTTIPRVPVMDRHQWSFTSPWGPGNTPHATPTVYNNTSYPSASAALEAYIGDHVGESKTWKIRAKYEKDVEDLLIQKRKNTIPVEQKPSHKKGARPVAYSRRGKSSQEDLRQYLDIRRTIEESYQKIQEQSSQSKSGTVKQ